MISKQDVLHIAKLSKLNFNEIELENFTNEIDKIIEYVNTVSNIDTSEVDDKLQTINAETDLRADVAKPSLTQEDAIKNASVKEEGAFSVPAIIE